MAGERREERGCHGGGRVSQELRGETLPRRGGAVDSDGDRVACSPDSVTGSVAIYTSGELI